MGGNVFDRKSVSEFAIVERPISQWYGRRAGATALVVGLVCDALATAVLSVFSPLLLAVVLGALIGMISAFTAALLVRAWPVLRVLWWWSIEIAAVVVVTSGWVSLSHLTTWWIASAVLLAAASAVFVPGRSRRLVWAWSGCLVVRHRLRLCFATLIRSQARGTSGRPPVLPLLLWARPTPAGQRVWVWLRPGLSVDDLEGKGPLLAVACIAREVRITAASERYAGLLRIDVARRDPLSGRVDSPLALLVPGLSSPALDVPVSPAVPSSGLELADIEEPTAPQQARGGRR